MDINKINELESVNITEDIDQLIIESSQSGDLQKINLATIKSDINDLLPSDGIKGPKGYTGVKGDSGSVGASGDKGDTGDVGDRGLPGQKGVKGITGSIGDVGDTGSSGPKGIKGDKGSIGQTGETGNRGLRGSVGVPAADGEKGYRGIQGNQGVIGDSGDIGDIGQSYDKNNPLLILRRGIKGERGDPATTGLPGDTGDYGDTGNIGIQGRRGQRGLPGKRESKVDYPVYGAKLFRNWNTIFDGNDAETANEIDYLEKKDFLTEDYSKLRYKFIKILFKVNSDYIPRNIVDIDVVRTCVLMIPGKITKWSPVIFGSPSILWYKNISDTTNSIITRTHNRQGVQIFVDTDNFSSSESEIPFQKIRLIANKPNDSFQLDTGLNEQQFKIIGVYGTNDL